MFIFDSHVHIGQIGPWYVTAEMLINDMKHNGVKMCLVQGPGEALTIEQMTSDNDMVASAIKKFPKELPLGIAHVNPRLGDTAIKELKRAFSKLGLKGVKLMPPYQNFHITSELTRPILELCEKYNGSIHIHNDWTDARCSPRSCAELASRFPNLTFFLSHTPREPINKVRDMMCGQALRQKNVILDTSAAFDSEIETVAKEHPDRIVFGSDWPAFRYGFCKAKVEVCNLSENVKAKILGVNLARIFGVDIK